VSETKENNDMMNNTEIEGRTGTLMTVSEFKECCDDTMLMDGDGSGDMIVNWKIVTSFLMGKYHAKVIPSERHLIPEHVTYILWYNK